MRVLMTGISRHQFVDDLVDHDRLTVACGLSLLPRMSSSEAPSCRNASTADTGTRVPAKVGLEPLGRLADAGLLLHGPRGWVVTQQAAGLADALRPRRREPYLQAPIPSSRDRVIFRLMDSLSDEVAVGSAATEVTTGQPTVLVAYIQRMATLAVRERSPARLLLGLQAAAIASTHHEDRRDLIVALAGAPVGDPADSRAGDRNPAVGHQGLSSFTPRAGKRETAPWGSIRSGAER